MKLGGGAKPGLMQPLWPARSGLRHILFARLKTNPGSCAAQGLGSVRIGALDRSADQKQTQPKATAGSSLRRIEANCRAPKIFVRYRVEQPEQRAQHDANRDTSDHRKVERGAVALEHEIARQPSEPNPRQNRPHDAGEEDHQSEPDEKALHVQKAHDRR